MTKIDDPLFPPGTVYVEVECWACSHRVELTPDKLPTGIIKADFERRAVCKCGTDWPRVTRYPKPGPKGHW
jgi:hypothetical protein